MREEGRQAIRVAIAVLVLAGLAWLLWSASANGPDARPASSAPAKAPGSEEAHPAAPSQPGPTMVARTVTAAAPPVDAGTTANPELTLTVLRGVTYDDKARSLRALLSGDADETGPCARCQLRLMCAEDRDGDEPPCTDRERRLTTDSTGKVRFTVGPGPHRVIVDERGLFGALRIDAGTDELPEPLVTRFAGTIELRIEDPQGRPVQATIEDEGVSEATDAAGRITLEVPTDGYFTVEAKGYVEAMREPALQPGEHRSDTIVLQPAAELTVETTCDGIPCKAAVYVNGEDAMEDVEGRWVAAGLPIGTAHVGARRTEGDTGDWSADADVTVTAGEHKSLVLDLAREVHGNAVLQGRVTDQHGTPLTDAAVFLSCGALVKRTRSDEDGRYRFEELNPGPCDGLRAAVRCPRTVGSCTTLLHPPIEAPGEYTIVINVPDAAP